MENGPAALVFRGCEHHRGESLNRVCVHVGCLHHEVICPKCKDSNHTGHTTVYLDEFVEALDCGRYRREASEIQDAKRLKSQAEETIRKTMTKFQECGDKLMKSLDESFTKVLHRLENDSGSIRSDRFVYDHTNTRDQISRGIKAAMGSYHNLVEWERLAPELAREVESLQEKNELMGAMLQAWLDEGKHVLQDVRKMYCTIEERVITQPRRGYSQEPLVQPPRGRQRLVSTRLPLPVVSPFPTIPKARLPPSPTNFSQPTSYVPNFGTPFGTVKWNQKLKHPDISIDGATASRNQGRTAEWVCCLADLSNSPIIDWSFKVLNSRLGIGLGIIEESTAINMGYWKGSEIGKSVSHLLMINSLGIENSAFKKPIRGVPFKFGDNDDIHCHLDYNEKEFRIKKGESCQVFRINSSSSRDRYYACVFLSEGNSVSIKGSQ